MNVIDTTKMDENLSTAQKIKKALPDHKVFEVVVKRVYAVLPHSHVNIDNIEDDWFNNGRIHGSHAHRDASQVGGGDEVISIVEIDLEDNDESND
jgi:hypothetical protein